jgi:hypothetical protein
MKVIKKLIKKAAVKALQQAQQWEAEAVTEGPFDSWAEPYTLNSTFLKVVRAGGDHQYAWGVTQAVNLAARLNIPRVSLIEFGVAGGGGLLTLERLADILEEIYNISIEIYGFDTGAGLPRPSNFQDMPNLWSEGFFPMEVRKLQKRLKRAKLKLGMINETIPEFVKSEVPPIAFISFDVDLYSSTKAALAIFDANCELFLPRVHLLFDDVMGYTFGDQVGERLAISEFNTAHSEVKLSPIHGLRYYVPKPYRERWMWEKNYMAHLFGHPLYASYDGLIPSTNFPTSLRT